MPNSFDQMVILFSAALFILTAVFLLLSPRHRHLLSNRYMALFLLAQGLRFLGSHLLNLVNSADLIFHPLLLYPSHGEWIMGPALYFSIVSRFSSPDRIQSRFLPHLIPFALMLLIQTASLTFLSAQHLYFISYGLTTASYLHLGLYSLFAILELKKIRIRAVQASSSDHQIHALSWLLVLLTCLGLVWLIALLNQILPYIVFKQPVPWSWLHILNLLFTSYPIFLALFRLKPFILLPELNKTP
jgi:hypothetical protein